MIRPPLLLANQVIDVIGNESLSTNVRLTIVFDWDEKGVVGVSSAGKLVFPKVPAAPGVYRFRVSDANGTEVYIGQSQDLRHRMLRNYASQHKGKTTVRIRELLFQHLKEQRSVQLAIAERITVEVDGEQIPADLNERFIRLLVENAALTRAWSAGDRVHNL